MCFILGYAIQPGSFRFSALKWWSTPADTTTTENSTAPTAAEPVAPAPSSAQVEPAASTPDGVANATPQPSTLGATAPTTAVAAASPKATTPEPAAGTATVAGDAAPIRESANTKLPSSAATASNGNNNAPTAPRAETSTASAAAPVTTPPPAPSVNAGTPAPGNASDLTIDAPVPVSFFPVTAPSAGSPAKLMQLPEETILQTHDVVIRSHQFLFVQPLPGPESTHELQRVHLGDRIAKTDPGFAPAVVTQFQGSSIHLRSTIGADGKVADVQAISGPTTLIPTAVNAVRQWRYKPTDIDGKPIAIEEDIVIEVRPSHS
jgi:hypothetical protein